MTDDELAPYLTKPDHVLADEWESCFGAYTAALALYRRALAAISDRIRRGLAPTDEQHRAQEAAFDVLTVARAALLELGRSTPLP